MNSLRLVWVRQIQGRPTVCLSLVVCVEEMEHLSIVCFSSTSSSQHLSRCVDPNKTNTDPFLLTLLLTLNLQPCPKAHCRASVCCLIMWNIIISTRSTPIGGGRQNAAPLKFDPKPLEATIFGRFFRISINADGNISTFLIASTSTGMKFDDFQRDSISSWEHDA